MPVVLAFIACGILALLGLLHLALLFGAPLGRFAWGGREDVLTGDLRLRSAVAVVLAAVGIVVELQAGNLVTTLQSGVGIAAAVVMIAVFFAGFVISNFSASVYEKYLMTPTCIVLAAVTLIVLVTGHLPR